MKVIINKCYGGYGFDPFTIQKYADAKNVKLYWYERDYGNSCVFPRERFVKTTIEKINADESLHMGYYSMIKDMGEYLVFDWNKEDYDDVLGKYLFKFPEESESRTDSVLIEIIEKYGKLNTHGCHNPQVIEIPDGVEWTVNDYDGMETLVEKYRIFG
jgi:hypothetical protein